MIRLRDSSVSAVTMGILAAVVGFAGSFAVVLEGLRAVGATDAQASTGLMAASIAMGIGGIWLSATTRLPISVAWSTPGAALLVSTASGSISFAEAVGAFLVCALLLTLSGLWKPLGQFVSRIPTSLASAMLAGILFELCLAPVRAVAAYPLIGLIMFCAWLFVGKVQKLMAVPAALAVFLIYTLLTADLTMLIVDGATLGLFNIQWVVPSYSIAAITSVAIPLFIVTMASQNIPGVAVMQAESYDIPVSRSLTVTGVLSLLAAPFGSHAVNLAAITAAMCAGSDAHTNRDRRYWAAIICGICYILFGLFAGLITLVVSLAPAILLQAVAGFALLGAFTASTVKAFETAAEREAAAVTFITAASGLSIAGVGGAFWGLLGGLLVYRIQKLFHSRQSESS